MKNSVFFLLSWFVFSSFGIPEFSEKGYMVTLKITHIRNDKGRFQVHVYRSQSTFEKETPYKVFYISKKELRNGVITHKLGYFPPGTYGFALLDDEDSDDEMDYGLMLPKEGFGFSDYYHTAWSRPSFHDFKFNLSGHKTVIAKVRYV